MSGGHPPHPALTTASIEQPIAGVDFPTDSVPTVKAVLVLYAGKRIGLDVVPRLGRDGYQPVLRFPRRINVVVRLSYANEELSWLIPVAGDTRSIKVSEIGSIQKAKAGIDFPTDGPPDMHRNFYVLVLLDEQRIELR